MASLLSVIVILAIFGAAMWLTVKTAERFPEAKTENRALGYGCLVFLVWFFVLGFLFWPSVEVLKSYSCGKARDYELCMDPPDHDWM